MRKRIASGLCLLVVLVAPHLHAEELRIAVAANFAATLQRIQQRFERQTGHQLTLIRGSTGKLYAQIRHGAPYDVFLAADSQRPRLLEQDGLGLAGSRFTYAIGKLALWGGDHDKHLPDRLRQGDFNKLALANPKTAPYGRAAMEVLQHMQLNAKYKDRLVYGENIAQAFQFVQSGSASLGFVALSHVKPVSAHYWLPPADYYQPLEQQLVILSSSDKPVLAQEFVQFLQSGPVKDLIRQQGYDTL